MRLLIINPNSDHETNRRIEEKLSETFGEWILFDCVCIEEAPKLVASKEGEVASAAAMIKMKALKIAAGRKREGAAPLAQPLRCFLHLTEILHAFACKIS